MARPKSKNLTRAEQRIMQVLWRRGEASVRQITADLAREYDLALTTVQTTTRILADKGYAGFTKQGRSLIYRPVVSKRAAQAQALKNLLGGLFDGSPQLLAEHLVEADELTEADIKALRALLDNHKPGENT
ncbi:MAG: BlaI/MecI/CopY family transcriptional regulator [Robiginitomaculum sp.]|nr:BlaI/MecI/CopY family transcriptional regulator [Robiginitomaculum sp.]